MQYIKLEDVQKIINSYNKYQELTDILNREINSLSSIDPTYLIEEMVRDERNNYKKIDSYRTQYAIRKFEELLQKFNS